MRETRTRHIDEQVGDAVRTQDAERARPVAGIEAQPRMLPHGMNFARARTLCPPERRCRREHDFLFPLPHRTVPRARYGGPYLVQQVALLHALRVTHLQRRPGTSN